MLLCQKKCVKCWNNRCIRRDQDHDLAWWRDPDHDPIVRNYLKFPVQFTSMRNIWAMWVDTQCFCAKKKSEKSKQSLRASGSGSRHCVMAGSGSRPDSSYLPEIFRPIHFYEKYMSNVSRYTMLLRQKKSEKSKQSLRASGSGSRPCVMAGSGSRPDSSYLPEIFRPIHFYEKYMSIVSRYPLLLWQKIRVKSRNNRHVRRDQDHDPIVRIYLKFSV
jgi:hypothetical protein